MDIKKLSLSLARSDSHQSRDLLEECLDTITLQDLEIKKREIANGTWGAIDIVQMINDEWKDCAFAVKRINKLQITEEMDKRHILAEMEIMSSIKCNFIVRHYKTFQDSMNLYFLMEFCQGGDLWSTCPVNKDAAVFYTACVVEALSYLHQRNIMHRDIKAENIVLDSKGYAKLIDFGLARRLENNTKAVTICGSGPFYAPEIVQIYFDASSPGYDETVDLWCLGQTVYFMLTGKIAFESFDQAEMFSKISKGMEQNALWNENISEDVKKFILQLCEMDPTRRLGCKDRGGFDSLRQHSWFKGIAWSLLRDRCFPPPTIPYLDSATDTRFFDGISDKRNTMCDCTSCLYG